MPYRCCCIWPKAGKTVSSSKLSAAIGVSHRYLLQISAKLRAAGFIRAAHGSSGGLALEKAPEEISLYDVILGMEGAVQTGDICGIPSDEISQEMFILENEYRRVDCMLETSAERDYTCQNPGDSLIYKIPIQTARLYKQLTKETQDCPESVRICEKRLRCRL